jgi:hypothetical protein
VPLAATAAAASAAGTAACGVVVRGEPCTMGKAWWALDSINSHSSSTCTPHREGYWTMHPAAGWLATAGGVQCGVIPHTRCQCPGAPPAVGAMTGALQQIIASPPPRGGRRPPPPPTPPDPRALACVSPHPPPQTHQVPAKVERPAEAPAAEEAAAE